MVNKTSFLLTAIVFCLLATNRSNTTPANGFSSDFLIGKEEFCEQHTQICPVDSATWQGEKDGWQFVGRRWHAISYTESPQKVIWEWSRPYTGKTAAYKGFREDHYSDFTDVPAEYPKPSNSVTRAYEYELWQPINNQLRQMRYAGKIEAETRPVGDVDCTSGLLYPVTNQSQPFTKTDLAVMVNDKCAKGGYAFAKLEEVWGEANTEQRNNACDDPKRGVPASESAIANQICKTSPSVGVVYQGYAWAARPNDPNKPVLGCEAVLYAWGWEKPKGPATGKDYMLWNRNGMLRFSHWLGFWAQNTMPAANDAWWIPQCEKAWTEVGNVIYSGQYVIGDNLYTDTILNESLNQKIYLPIGVK